MPRRPYRSFEVTGLELEYAIVDGDLRPRCLVEDALRALNHGRTTCEIDYRDVGFSAELAAHVFEIRTQRPETDLVAAHAHLVAGIARFSRLLAERFEARLMPCGMHPFMKPADTQVWRRGGSLVYNTYAKVFGIREHGWLNLQSCHVNLPFGTEDELVAMHNAVAALIPYLPALTASSPLIEGRLGPDVCNRLAAYARNQRRIPSIAGRVVPEYMHSSAAYKRELLGGIYKDLGKVRGTERLRHEWVNSRGAILRFMRDALEIRVLDLQECPAMDVAVACFVRGALQWMVARMAAGKLTLPPHEVLVADYQAVVRAGSAATVQAPHLRAALGLRSKRPGALLAGLAEAAVAFTKTRERKLLALASERIRTGNLSERIAAKVRKAGRGQARRHDATVAIYEELIEALQADRPWT